MILRAVDVHWRDFFATRVPGTCYWCGMSLIQTKRFKKPGVRGDGFFCDFGCSHQFAVEAAKRGAFFDDDGKPPAKPMSKHEVTLGVEGWDDDDE